ncbi:MAG: hypothetical protein ACFB0B_12085 [Thermonemataceae bacterium]
MKEFDLNKHTPRKTPFDLPDNYFSTLSEKIQHQVDRIEGEELYTKQLPMRVPQGYFEQLLARIQERLFKPQPKLWQRQSIQYALVGVMTVLLVWWFIPPTNDTLPLQTAEVEFDMAKLDISKKELVEYLTYTLPASEIVASIELSQVEMEQLAVGIDVAPSLLPEEDTQQEEVLQYIDEEDLEELLLEDIALEEVEELL